MSAAAWFDGTPLTFGFWSAHPFDIAAVFAGTVWGFIVHRFVASLDDKDPITRDHVVRSALLAVALGSELRLSPWELRRVGLAALLHDVGKLEIPDGILNKTGHPATRNSASFEPTRRSVPKLARQSPILDDIAPLIEAHHERVDGAGYPFGRSGDQLPISARIISVSDAFDAIANTRQYCAGAGWRRTLEVLQEHAGTQWDVEVVAAMVRMLERDDGPADNTPLDAIGRHHPEVHDGVSCGCVDALPDAVVRELEHA